VRRRLVATIAGVATASVVLFAVPLGLVLERAGRDEALLRLQRDAVAATRQVDLGAGRGDRVELPRSSARLGAYDRAGRLTAGLGPAVADGPVRSALRSARPADGTAGSTYVAAAPLLAGERVTGAVRAERGAGEAGDATDAWLVLGAIGGAVILLAALAALFAGGRLARPLERLATTARRLGEGDFATRAPRAGISEVDAVAAALDATAERLDDLVRRERAFSVDASHQLRTPLAALRLELEAVELRGGGTPEVAAALAQVDRLQATIDTLLSLARDDSRRSAPLDVVGLLDQAETRWRGPLTAAGRSLRVTVRRPRRAVADAHVVLEILDVLLDNAVRYGAGAVSLTVRDLPGWLALDVGDEGAGFDGDPESAFTRRGRGADGDGHGIGLALARSLAYAEGGRLAVTVTGPHPVVTLFLPAEGAVGETGGRTALPAGG